MSPHPFHHHHYYHHTTMAAAPTGLAVEAANMAEAIVVDSGAFIRAARLERLGREVYTLAEVIAELRDEKTRERLQQPQLYELKFREPSSEALDAVSAFAKKTGDYKTLSAVDLKVLALTWMLEKEKHGGVAHLRTEPFKQIRVSNKPPPVVASNAENSGFYFPRSKSSTTDVLPSLPPTIPFVLPQFFEASSKSDYTSRIGNVERERTPREQTLADSAETDRTGGGAEDGGARDEQEEQDDEQNEEEGDDDEEDDEEEDDEDDDAGWITPENIHLANAAWKNSGAAEAPLDAVKVGCITTDFAMQNVLIQMGLRVISVDGLLIKKAKQFALKCHSCFKITNDMNREFCPTCGNATLLRIAVSVDDSGVITHYQAINSKKLSLKGSIYPIPLPKGGRNNTDIILSEDQKERLARMTASRKKGGDGLDEDFAVYTSPFAPIDMKTKMAPSAQFGFGKRNPNEPRKKAGKRKKASNTR